MTALMNLLASLVSIYILLIFIRIIFTWFSGVSFGKFLDILKRITDPYLNWWRRFKMFQFGFLDLSPIAGMAALSVLQTIFATIARYGKITLGFILAISISAIWSAVAFIIGFLIIVLILRLIGYMTNRDTYTGFWNIIDTIARPILYRINRIFFGKRIVNYTVGILAAILLLLIIWAAGTFAIGLIGDLLYPHPIQPPPEPEMSFKQSA